MIGSLLADSTEGVFKDGPAKERYSHLVPLLHFSTVDI